MGDRKQPKRIPNPMPEKPDPPPAPPPKRLGVLTVEPRLGKLAETKYSVIETFEEFEGLADWHIHGEADPDVAKLCIPCALKREIEALLAALNKIAYEPIGDPEASAVQVLKECVEIARAALAKVTHG